MNSLNFRDYWLPAAENLFTTPDACSRLDYALGMAEYHSYCRTKSKYDVEMSNELKNLLRLLAGEHGQTILKMYRIKRGLGP